MFSSITKMTSMIYVEIYLHIKQSETLLMKVRLEYRYNLKLYTSASFREVRNCLLNMIYR